MATIDDILGTVVSAVREDVPHPPGTYEFEYQGFEFKETQSGLPMMIFNLKVTRVVNVAQELQTNFEAKQGVSLDATTFQARQVRSANVQWAPLFDTFCLNFARRLGVADIAANTISDQIKAIVPGRRFEARLTQTPNKVDPTLFYTNLDVGSIQVTKV